MLTSRASTRTKTGRPRRVNMGAVAATVAAEAAAAMAEATEVVEVAVVSEARARLVDLTGRRDSMSRSFRLQSKRRASLDKI